jgi:hypothetical protein
MSAGLFRVTCLPLAALLLGVIALTAAFGTNLQDDDAVELNGWVRMASREHLPGLVQPR